MAQNGYNFVVKYCSIDSRVGELINYVQEIVK